MFSGYGNACQQPQNPSSQPGCVLQFCFPTAFPNGFTLGGINWSDYLFVQLNMPYQPNAFIGQTVALKLNLAFDASSENQVCQDLLRSAVARTRTSCRT
jgi:hypothetical protein